MTNTYDDPKVPKEKRLLPVPKLTETTEEQEKRSVNKVVTCTYIK